MKNIFNRHDIPIGMMLAGMSFAMIGIWQYSKHDALIEFERMKHQDAGVKEPLPSQSGFQVAPILYLAVGLGALGAVGLLLLPGPSKPIDDETDDVIAPSADSDAEMTLDSPNRNASL